MLWPIQLETVISRAFRFNLLLLVIRVGKDILLASRLLNDDDASQKISKRGRQSVLATLIKRVHSKSLL